MSRGPRTVRKLKRPDFTQLPDSSSSIALKSASGSLSGLIQEIE